MPSEIEICNLALSHIGKPPIQALSDPLREAQECKLLYPRVRDSVLREHAWNFATKRLTLALLTETYTGWLYAYQFPTDCIRALRIWNPYTEDENKKIEYEISVSDDLASRVILTDQDEAVLIYTAAVTNPNIFDPAFIDALAYRLAAELAVPLRGDTRIQQAVMQTYLSMVGVAKVSNSNERFIMPDESSALLDARD